MTEKHPRQFRVTFKAPTSATPTTAPASLTHQPRRLPRGTRQGEYHERAVPEIPLGCIESTHLRSLANAIDRLSGWHELMGGQTPGTPCLRKVVITETGKAEATVQAGEETVRMTLEKGEWQRAKMEG